MFNFGDTYFKPLFKKIGLLSILINDERNDEVKISQYTDDTTLILDGSQKSLTSAIQILDDVGKISGLKLNDSKTEALWIGSKIGHEQILVSGKKFKWPKCEVKTLGLWLSTDPDTA